jgi:hypothetical protein
MLNQSLARDVVVVVAVKTVLAIAAAIFLFGPHQRPKIDGGSVAARLLDASYVNRQWEIPSP